MPILLFLSLVVVLAITYAAYDIYKLYQPESLCVSECSKEGCENQTGFSCVKDINNCYYKKYKDIEIGNCSAECLTSDDCNETLKCVSNKCVEPRCGDERCDKKAGEDCESCLEDCPLDSGTICCSGEIIDGTCCSNSDCTKEHEICNDYTCEIGPYCGDETCDEEKGENCDTCKADCRPSETEKCCSGEIVTGDCCKDSQCEEDLGFECKKHKCTLVSSE